MKNISRQLLTTNFEYCLLLFRFYRKSKFMATFEKGIKNTLSKT